MLIFINSGSKNNYISEKAVKHMKLNTEECNTIKNVFRKGEIKERANVIKYGIELKKSKL